MSDRQRLNGALTDPGAYQAIIEVEKYIHSRGLDPHLLHLIKIRASQINKCAWCLDMHLDEARQDEMDERKLGLIAAWHEAPTFFDARERAALALTEQVTLISEQGVTDDVWAQVTQNFDDKQIVVVLTAIGAINMWNRLNVAVRTDVPSKPGSTS
jgi:AhpD family alkylhydroperoxidase